MSVTIANIWLGIPFNLVILYSGLQNISDRPLRGGVARRCRPWRQFWSITFPLLRPVTAITLLLGFVYTLKVVDIIWIMTMGTGSSQTLATWAYAMAFGKGSSAVIKYSEASVVGTILLVVALVMGFVYLAVQRRQEDAMNTVRRTWWKTALGVVFIAIMLFPVYWMVNVSFTPRTDIRDGDLYPKNLHVRALRRRPARPAALPGTSLIVGLGAVALTLVISAPARSRCRSCTSLAAAR